MPNIEKVMKGLECCSQMAGEACRKCPYTNECDDGLFAGSAHLAADALTLLREYNEVNATIEPCKSCLEWDCNRCEWLNRRGEK